MDFSGEEPNNVPLFPGAAGNIKTMATVAVNGEFIFTTVTRGIIRVFTDGRLVDWTAFASSRVSLN